MLVSLYISRIILDTLGVENFGIYNLIGGFVLFFSFLNVSMSSATQRFISFETGTRDEEKLNRVFCMSVNIHLFISILAVVLIEVAGLWFLYNKMNIAQDRLFAAFWVFQFSVISLFFTINSVPYNALIIAREDMTVFAYVEMFGVLLKLCIVFMLHLFQYDRLIIYSGLLLLVAILLRFIYVRICKRKYKKIKYRFVWDRELFKEMTGFAGWTTLSAVTFMGKTQGIGLMFNLFIGIVVNAAIGIANQVNVAINSFAQNFRTAFFPQITKSYAEGDIQYMTRLVFSGAKLSYVLLLILSVPIIIEIDFVLNIWLKKIPEYTSLLVILIIADTMVTGLASTINTAMRATGKIKMYEITLNSLTVVSLVLCYFSLKNTGSILIAYIILIAASAISDIVTVTMCAKQIKFNPFKYFYDVFCKMIFVSAVSFSIAYLIHNNMEYGFLRFTVVGIASSVSIILCTYYFALKTYEKNLILNMYKQYKKINLKQ